MAEKSMKKDDDDCRVFLEIEGNELKIKSDIRKCYNYISTNYINNTLENLLKDIGIDEKEKEKIKKELPNNIKEIIENLNPLYQCLTPSMNINDSIKVKKLKDTSFKSEVVRGFAMTKGACSKNMGDSKTNASILLLDFDLNEHEIRDFSFMSEKKKNKKDKEKENKNSKKSGTSWAENIYKDIESLDVNVILISKGIDNKLLEKFTEKSESNSKPKPLIAIDVKSSSLEKISLCTKAKVIKSLKEFKNCIKEKDADKDKKANFLGSCLSFRTVDTKKFTEENTVDFECCDNIDNYKNFEKIIYRPKYKLMKFDTAINFNFLTLLISSSNKELLVSLKNALKNEIFITVRDFFLQQKVLHYLFCNFDNLLPSANKNNENDKDKLQKFKPITVYKKIQNQQISSNINQNDNNENPINNINNLNNNIKIDNEIVENEEKNKQNKLNDIKIISQVEEKTSKDSIILTPVFSQKTTQTLNHEQNQSLSADLLKDNKDNNTEINLNSNSQENSERTNCINSKYNKSKDSVTNASPELINESDINNNLNPPNTDNEKKIEIKSKNNYEYGFDTSIIRIKEANPKKLPDINLIKLRMCEGDKNFNQLKNDANNEKNDKNNKQNAKNEAELLKKLNYICGKAKNLAINFYETTGEQNDKQFGKFIFDMISEKNNICDNDKCKMEISKHFYYLYNSDFSRIKISYISKDNDFLKFIIDYIIKKNKEFENFENGTQITEEDYNSDIYSYGFCKICKKIATPLIKMPKDFFAYSTGKILNHFFYNVEMKNRKEIEYNLRKTNDEAKNYEVYTTIKCENNSFHDINRIFVTKFGALNFEYEKLKENIFLSVQQSVLFLDLKEKKSTNNLYSKDNKQRESKFNNFYEIIELIMDKLRIEESQVEGIKSKEEEIKNKIEIKKEEEKKIENVNETLEKKPENIDIFGIVDLVIKLLNDIKNYIIQPVIQNSNSHQSYSRDSLKLTINNTSSSESKEKYSLTLVEQIESLNSIDDSKLFGLKKRIAFRIVQLKCLYNNIRILVHKIKLYISFLKKPEKKDNDENNAADSEKPFKENPNNLNLKSEEQNLISTKNIIKNLIDNYVAFGQIHENENKNNKISDKYLKMLDSLTFYEEKPNEYSNIIKENDLSSIIYYAISSKDYKNYMKGKTNLLEYKNNDCGSNTNSMHDKNPKENVINETPTKLDQKLYETLLVFHSDKFTEKMNKNRLEAEILNKESSRDLQITIKSINPQKFIPNNYQSRRPTISIPTSVSTSPNYFSPKKADEDIEKKLDSIEEKISGFFNKMLEIKKKFNNLCKKDIKIGTTIGNFLEALKNVSSEYSTNESKILENKENNNESKDKKKTKDNIITKKIVVDNFITSYDEQIKSIKNNTDFQPKEDISEQNLDNKDAKDEDGEDGSTDIINLIGNLHHFEDYIPKSEIDIKIYYPRQFEALRIVYCSTYEDLLASMLESSVWSNVSGGKSKATFYKTKDEKYLFKSIKKDEFKMFLEMAFNYFQHMVEYLFHKMPSLLTKTLGVYEIRMKSAGKEENYYIMMMENLNYGINFEDIKSLKSYDLKGSLSNRYVSKQEQSKNENKKNENEIKKNINTNIVLHDSNFKEDNKNEPIPLDKQVYDLLVIAIHNDTLFLSKIRVVDYSLLLHIYQKNNTNYLRMGIIDYVRKYTWDKQLEHVVKIVLNGFKAPPTIVDPNDYKKRFNDAIKDYFIGI